MKKFLKVIRKKRGMSQCELAKKVGVTRSCLSKIETGKRVASVELLAKVSVELDFVPCVFMCDMLHKKFLLCDICKIKAREHLSPEERIDLILEERKDFYKKFEIFNELTSQANTLKGVENNEGVGC